MSSNSETVSNVRIAPDMTLAEAIELAKGFEQTAHRFYSSLVAQVRKEVQPLVRELAAEEKKHFELLDRVSREKGLIQHLRERTATPPTAAAFRSYIDMPTPPDDPLDDCLLEYAESRERIAYEHYGYLAELTPAGPLRELFEFLRDEEAGHQRALASRWAAMFSVF